jgi:hypothetical protein
MAGSPAQVPIITPRLPAQQQQQSAPQPPSVPAVRYHIDFQDFLDDLDAPYFNPYPANIPYST